jgi:hypothetical protein
MSTKKSEDKFDPFDPTGMMKSLRDASMDHWARVMTGVVNTETYAEASGEMLDAWLSGSAPFRKAIENAMLQALGNVKIPSSQDITRLAERLTNIEMRLDDMDAKLDELLRQKHEGS